MAIDEKQACGQCSDEWLMLTEKSMIKMALVRCDKWSQHSDGDRKSGHVECRKFRAVAILAQVRTIIL